MKNTKKNVLVHCNNVIKRYGSDGAEVFALRGVDLDVYAGELIMIVGPSGCGKTTLLSIISSLLKQDSGICSVLNKSINQLSDDEKSYFRSKSIGFVFQSFNLIPTLSVIENVAVSLSINGLKRDYALKKAEKILDEVGLFSRGDSKPHELSGGQKQKVAIARALVHNPLLIVCDEPTSSLDYESGRLIMNILRNIVDKEGKTLILVTHDNRIYKYADRIAYMEDGRIIKIEEKL